MPGIMARCVRRDNEYQQQYNIGHEIWITDYYQHGAWWCVRGHVICTFLYLFERHQALDVFLSLANCCLSPLIYKFKAVHTHIICGLHYLSPAHSHACLFIEPSRLLCAVIFHLDGTSSQTHAASVIVKQLDVALIRAVITQCLKISWAAFSLFSASKPLEQNY